MKLSDLYYEISDFLDNYIDQARYEWGDKCVSDEVALALKEMKWHFDRNYVYEPIRDEDEYVLDDRGVREWVMPPGGGGGV